VPRFLVDAARRPRQGGTGTPAGLATQGPDRTGGSGTTGHVRGPDRSVAGAAGTAPRSGRCRHGRRGGVRGLIIGGSVGWGEPWPLSDIDLLPVYAGSFDPAREVERQHAMLIDWWAASGHAQPSTSAGWPSPTTKSAAQSAAGRPERQHEWPTGAERLGGRGRPEPVVARAEGGSRRPRARRPSHAYVTRKTEIRIDTIGRLDDTSSASCWRRSSRIRSAMRSASSVLEATTLP
jgi:hypothetical protein